MKPPEQIDTERLVLRKPRREDAPDIFTRKYMIHPNISDVPRDSYIYAITK